MAYSLSFRQKVFQIKDEEGLTYKETGKRFHIDIRTLFRWKNRMDPKTTRKKPATKIDMQRLQKDIQDNPDRYQYERAQDYGVTQGAIWFALQRLNVSYKKNSVSSKIRSR
jgi:transposase